jgi:hypothetical protein
MVAYGSAVALSDATNVVPLGIGSRQHVANDYAKTAYKAAISLANLSKSMTGSTFFKV